MTMLNKAAEAQIEQFKLVRKRRFGRFFLCAALIAISLSCAKPANKTPESKTSLEIEDTQGQKALSIDPKKDSYLFTYVEGGRSKTTSKTSEVPKQYREHVSVVDISVPPAARAEHRVAYFANLTQKDEKGHYRMIAVSRFNAARGETLKFALPKVPENNLVLYSAEWCGFCKRAKAWFDQEKIAYVIRDVDQMPGASDELKAKLTKAGIQSGGIPVTDWMGTMVIGYDVKKFATLLKEKPPASTQP